MKAEKYTDFFEEDEKSMWKDSIHRAERDTNKIIPQSWGGSKCPGENSV